MDPTTTWKSIFPALENEDYEVALHLTESLGEWLDNGGFLPDGFNETNRDTLMSALRGVRTVCCMALSMKNC